MWRRKPRSRNGLQRDRRRSTQALLRLLRLTVCAGSRVQSMRPALRRPRLCLFLTTFASPSGRVPAGDGSCACAAAARALGSAAPGACTGRGAVPLSARFCARPAENPAARDPLRLETRVRTLPSSWASSGHVTTRSTSPQHPRSPMLTYAAKKLSAGATPRTRALCAPPHSHSPLYHSPVAFLRRDHGTNSGLGSHKAALL